MQVGKIYSLGEVLVSAKVNRSSVSAEEMRMFNAGNVGNSVRILPSIVLGGVGSRNESTIYIHGFDIRSIPVFIDGIPVYVPYDGYVDLARFITTDLAKIDVSRGFSPVSYGPNALGGAINLISMKPVSRFDLVTRAGVLSGKGYETSVNAGSNLGKAWLQAGFSTIRRDFLSLPASFDTSALEQDHKRDNSFTEDIKFSIKAGFVPSEGDEYSLNYIFAHGEKGNPVYLGADRNTRIRYWRWPYWDKQSIYYISRTSFGRAFVLKARGYFDSFSNKLSSFDDATYSTQLRKSAFNSYYNDNTWGANIELSSRLGTMNNILLSVHSKNDYHREHNNTDPASRFSDNTLSAGIDDIHTAGEKLKIISGLSYNTRKSLNASSFNADVLSFETYPGNRSNSVNAQAAAEYTISNAIDVDFSIACKSRFATMKDRFSYRLGTGIPNPALKPENAVNFDLSSSIMIIKDLYIEPELFMSRLFNTIQLVSNVRDDLSQMQNTGNSLFGGFDLNIDYQTFSFIKISLAYSYTRMKNLSNPGIRFTNVPHNKIFLSAEVNVTKKLIFNLYSDYNSGSYSATDGSRYSPGFFVLNSHLLCKIKKSFSAEAGINNILDRLYFLEEGYPEPGRNFYISVSFDLRNNHKNQSGSFNN